LSFIFSGCGGPNAFLCTFDATSSDPLNWKFYCFNMKDGSEKELQAKDGNKMVCFSPDDYKTLKQYWKDQCR
jgi:hypothetical protein